MSQTDLIIHDEKDNVAVVVIDKTSKNQECIGWVIKNLSLQNFIEVLTRLIQDGYKLLFKNNNLRWRHGTRIAR